MQRGVIRTGSLTDRRCGNDADCFPRGWIRTRKDREMLAWNSNSLERLWAQEGTEAELDDICKLRPLACFFLRRA
jgi:hypothetical protein